MAKRKQNIQQQDTHEAVEQELVNDMIYSAADRARTHEKTRERIGVFVFVVSIFLIIAGVFGYMILGHKFDLAASTVDQSFGSLSDYAAVVFEGTATTKTVKTENRVERILRRASDLIWEDNDEDIDSDQVLPATTSNISAIYKQENATVCNIHIDDLNAYKYGEIFQRNGWNIGVLSVPDADLQAALAAKKAEIDKEAAESNKNTSQQSQQNAQTDNKKSATSKDVKTIPAEMKALQDKVNNLRYANNADMVIIIASSQDVLDLVKRVDVAVVNTVRDNIGEEGQYVGDVYVMPNPVAGSVGAIVSTRAKSFSATVYDKIDKDLLEQTN